MSVPRHWRIAHVAQSMPEGNTPVTDFVLVGDTRLQEAQAQLHAAEATGDGDAIALAHAALADAGAHDARARAQALLLGLGFAPAELDRPVDAFSGGWRMRLQLARALMCPSDLLLLDEPSMGLSPLFVEAIFDIVGTLNRERGTTILLVEQNASMALGIAHHGYVLQTGEIRLSRAAAELARDESVRKAYLGEE